MRFDMEERTPLAYRMHSCCMRLLKESKCLVNGWLQNDHTYYKSKVLMSTERVNWLYLCCSWCLKINILMDISPFCWTELIPQCISISRMIRRGGQPLSFTNHTRRSKSVHWHMTSRHMSMIFKIWTLELLLNIPLIMKGFGSTWYCQVGA